MVKVNLPKGQVVIDPFNGQSLSREELSERLEPFRQRRLAGSDGDSDYDTPIGLYLQSAPPRDIISRMLHNLKEIHRTQEDWPRLIAVMDRLIVLYPDAWAEYRDRGLAWAVQGQAARAVPDLEQYLTHADSAADISGVAERLAQLRRQT